MDTRKMAKEYRLSQWAQIIQARKESGKSVKDFVFGKYKSEQCGT
jgi:putative transposase